MRRASACCGAVIHAERASDFFGDDDDIFRFNSTYCGRLVKGLFRAPLGRGAHKNEE